MKAFVSSWTMWTSSSPCPKSLFHFDRVRVSGCARQWVCVPVHWLHAEMCKVTWSDCEPKITLANHCSIPWTCLRHKKWRLWKTRVRTAHVEKCRPRVALKARASSSLGMCWLWPSRSSWMVTGTRSVFSREERHTHRKHVDFGWFWPFSLKDGVLYGRHGLTSSTWRRTCWRFIRFHEVPFRAHPELQERPWSLWGRGGRPESGLFAAPLAAPDPLGSASESSVFQGVFMPAPVELADPRTAIAPWREGRIGTVDP